MSRYIPKKIYQSWKTKNLSPEMARVTDRVKKLNPGYEYFLYDDKDCRQFLLTHFGPNYAQAFDALIPGAFKCDFWRYAILYVQGGIYMDIDMVPHKSFDELLRPDDEFVSAVDRQLLTVYCAIFQGIIACRPKHPAIGYALQITFANIASRRSDIFEPLAITGPVVMGVAMNLYWGKKNTHERIQPGTHSQGVRLWRHSPHPRDVTLDENGIEIFRNKFDGYKPVNSYGLIEPFHDDPRRVKRQVIRYVFFGIVILFVIALTAFLIIKRKLHRCLQSCPMA